MNSLNIQVENVLVWVDTKKCKACSICVSLCPSGTIAMVSDPHSTLGATIEVIEPESCIGCRDCELHCPDFAIFVAEKDKNINFAKLTEKSKARAIAIKENNFRKIGV